MIKDLQSKFAAHLEKWELPSTPAGLYQPISYLLGIGGKRVRPVLAILGNKLVGGNGDQAMPVATAVEVFHNFTLMHDDIMDNAPVRRGKTTVHEKWDVNTAILSGDVMLVKAYQELSHLEPEVLPVVFEIFNETAVGVCEGQQMDMNFETQADVSIDQYLQMIGLKTAVLLSGALRMGAAVAGASRSQLDALHTFGFHIGRAFQLQDDYLDAFGDPDKVGKMVGGDIVANKQTFLLLKCLELCNEQQRIELQSLMNDRSLPAAQKVQQVKAIFLATGVDKASAAAMDKEYEIAVSAIAQMEGDQQIKAVLLGLADQLMNRVS